MQHFRQKCLGKMGQVASEGRTVLLVSHNMQAISTLCRTVFLLEGGRVVLAGAPGTLFPPISSRIPPSYRSSRRYSKIRPPRRGTTRSAFALCALYPKAPPPAARSASTPLFASRSTTGTWTRRNCSFELDLYTLDGTAVFESISVDDPSWHPRPLPVGLFRSVVLIPEDFLNQGSYRIRIVFIDEFGTAPVFDYPFAAVFTVHDLSPRRISWYGRFQGIVRPRLRWTTTPLLPNERDAVME